MSEPLLGRLLFCIFRSSIKSKIKVMKILQAAQNILISRAVSVFVDMRDTVDSPSEYRNHFGGMGEEIAKIESYENFGDICTAIEKGEFSILGLAGDDDELSEFLYDVKKYMEKYNK